MLLPWWLHTTTVGCTKSAEVPRIGILFNHWLVLEVIDQKRAIPTVSGNITSMELLSQLDMSK